MQNLKYIGIDISKTILHVHFESKVILLDNTEREVLRFIKKLNKKNFEYHIVCESTGGYEKLLVKLSHKNDIAISTVTASRIRDYARACGVLAKTDDIDAKMISSFAQSVRPDADPKPTKADEDIINLMDRRTQLVKMLTSEKNRRDKPNTHIVSVEEHICFLKEKISEIEVEIKQLEKSCESFSKKADIMREVCGVGDITAWSVLAYLPEIGKLNRNEISALAGLAPYNCDSGGRYNEKNRYIKGGRSKIRTVLYTSILSATKHNEVLREVYQSMKAKGKPSKVAQVACMRKIIIYINGLIKKEFFYENDLILT